MYMYINDIVSLFQAPPTHPRFPVTSKAGSSGKTINRPLSLPSNKGGGPQLVRSRTAADARKIKDLERQVQELYNALKKRHPNSIPVLMHASAKTVEDERETVEYMERRVREQEGQVREREEEGKRRLDQLQEQFHEMEVCRIVNYTYTVHSEENTCKSYMYTCSCNQKF